jgi:chitodextrinase
VTKTVTAPATSTTVTGLTFGLQYSFTISATSAVGASPVSTPFGPVTPTFGVSISNRSLTEGNSGQKSFTFTITLTDAQTVPVTVDVATEDGSAEGTSDFAVLSTIVTLDPGQKSKTVTVRVSGDTIIEPDEVFFVNLSNASGGVITNARGTGTIRNDDIG